MLGAAVRDREVSLYSGAMATLHPVPFGRLVSRMLSELERSDTIFDLSFARFFRGIGGADLSVSFHGHIASTPFGPAAGPHGQLAQNLVLAFLSGGRILELKTVQVRDDLIIPRPCIDASTVGYNIEWSQELTLAQSLEEYVKASMLIDILVADGRAGIPADVAHRIFDISVGYDLAGIRSPTVTAFLRGMMDATDVVERLRREIPNAYARYRDVSFATSVSDSLTLSTFHGCPPGEIQRITEYLLTELELHCVVKLNPTLLGPVEARRIFHDALGYTDAIPDEAFEKDACWDQAVDIVGSLRDTARKLGRGFGVKLSNTLLVENHGGFLPASERVKYLSGRPLHVLAMALVLRFREVFGDALPISFSGGIDRGNFADAVSLGLVPVTVCTDLLRTGGYARARHYLDDLAKRMAACGAQTVNDFAMCGQGQEEASLRALEGMGEASAAEISDVRGALSTRGMTSMSTVVRPDTWRRWLSHVRVFNTRRYVSGLYTDPRYAHAQNLKSPPKVGTALSLFDCLTCDKCVPVCPNDANFTYVLPSVEIPVVRMRLRPDGGFAREDGVPLRLAKRHQLATYADLCNECGNCDVFCPEDGGPYRAKPRFFGSREAFDGHADLDGVYVARGDAGAVGRFDGHTYEVIVADDAVRYVGPGFDVSFVIGDPEGTLKGVVRADAVVDLTWYRVLTWLRRGVMDDSRVNFVNVP